MTWAFVLLLAVASFVVTAWLMKPPRAGRTAVLAALLLGLAGYAGQSHPQLSGAPTAPRERLTGNAEGVAARQKLASNSDADKGIVIADAFARNGRYADAATVLRGSVERNPGDAEAWLAMANALFNHAGQRLSPAADFAFQRARDATPENPGPSFFFGVALAQSGRLQEARDTWADLLARSPTDAPWRADLAKRLQELDQLIAQEQGARKRD